MNHKMFFPIILIAFGALIILHKFGIHLMGPIIGYLVPIAMIALGWLGIQKGSKFGWLIAGIGAIILLGKLAGWLVIILAIGLILYGLSILRRSPKHYH